MTKILLSFNHLSDFQHNPAQTSVVEADVGENAADGIMDRRERV